MTSNPPVRNTNGPRQYRFIYADRNTSDLVKQVYLKTDADAALLFCWLTTTAYIIPQYGVCEVTPGKIARSLGMDPGAVQEILSDLSEFGIEYDPENEILLVRPVVDQYVAWAMPNRNRRVGLEKYLSLLPDCRAKGYITSLMDHYCTGSVGVTTQATSEATTQVTTQATSKANSGEKVRPDFGVM